MTSKVCAHGSLQRSCRSCEYEAEIAELQDKLGNEECDSFYWKENAACKEREANLRCSQLLMVASEIAGDPKINPLDRTDPRWTPTLECAATLRAQIAAADERAIDLQARLDALTETYGASCRAARADAVREFAEWLGTRYDGDEPYSGYADRYLAEVAALAAKEK